MLSRTYSTTSVVLAPPPDRPSSKQLRRPRVGGLGQQRRSYSSYDLLAKPSLGLYAAQPSDSVARLTGGLSVGRLVRPRSSPAVRTRTRPGSAGSVGGEHDSSTHDLAARYGIDVKKLKPPPRTRFNYAGLSIELSFDGQREAQKISSKEPGATNLHEMPTVVAPNKISAQVGASLDSNGSWRHFEARNLKTLNTVSDRGLLNGRDLFGNVLNVHESIDPSATRTLPPRPKSAVRMSPGAPAFRTISFVDLELPSRATM